MTTKKQKRAVNKVVDYLESLQESGEQSIEVNWDQLREAGKALSASKPRISKRISKPLQAIADRVAACTQCSLCKTRTNTVPGQGNARPEIMFIGEGPGADEDQQGLPFVGRSGKLLTKIIEAMGFTREEVFIGNIVKCRPPGNRVPTPEEMDTCIPYLKEQIKLLKPKVIICLGATATKGLFGTKIPGITKIHGQWKSYEGIDVMPTYHPAYLLRNPPGKKDVWEDMKTVLRHLGRPIPKPSGKS